MTAWYKEKQTLKDWVYYRLTDIRDNIWLPEWLLDIIDDIRFNIKYEKYEN